MLLGTAVQITTFFPLRGGSLCQSFLTPAVQRPHACLSATEVRQCLPVGAREHACTLGLYLSQFQH